MRSSTEKGESINRWMDARRQKVENQIRKEELGSIRNKNRDMVLAHKPDMDTILKIAYPEIDEKIRARFELLRANKVTYEFLIGLLREFTRDRLIEYIKQGKMTITGSYKFQDLGKRIKEVQLCENEGFLTDEIVEQLIHGEFPLNFWPLLEATKYSTMEKLTGNTVEGIVVDTMGIDGRKKSILASYHGRYHTIG